MSSDNKSVISLLYPESDNAFKTMSDTTVHDLGIDTITTQITDDPKEQQMIIRVLSGLTPDPKIAGYRQDVFEDIYNLPEMRDKLLELMNQIDYLKDYGTWRKNAEEKPGLWDLMHRLEELKTFITCVESLHDCLSDSRIKSKGLKDLLSYIDTLYTDANFAQMKKDIESISVDANSIQSVTIGINVNSRFEAESLGLISVNAKSFKKSGIVSNFADAVAAKDKLNKDAEWDGDMRYEPVDSQSTEGALDKINATLTEGIMLTSVIGNKSTLSKIPDGDGTSNSTFYLSNIASKMMSHLVKKLRSVLSAYSDISIVTISKLIPELTYYINFSLFISKAKEKGMHFCKAEPVAAKDGVYLMNAKGFYNLKLASSLASADEVVDNDLVFDKDHVVFLLTGANRGGKTTLTQAAGLLYVLAQGGIYVPADSFEYTPVDMIFTHFPADEDKTMDLGRLGEECVRFKEIFSGATSESLVLLNESFSTTSFEEGYYIAVDAVRALRLKGSRTIYNTHMHKLAENASEFNVSSIVMASEEGKRSYKVVEKAPEGSSYARDIAAKYGVTYEMLTSQN
ncbi:MAG: DNA mismatch repair protein [Clostridiales bacterium]|nr:DNA mismatch repair protein [Clostridiales bacterium]